MQPHGFGYAVQKDGTVLSSLWCNDMPLSTDISKVKVSVQKEESRVLELGEAPSTLNQLHPPLPMEAYESNSFPIHSFAFVWRSCGVWTYAIVTDRPQDGECIRFVVDTAGSTKVLKRRYWAKCIRLPAVDNGVEEASGRFDNENVGIETVEIGDYCGVADGNGHDRKKSSKKLDAPSIHKHRK
ncbi:hypothetical protein ACHAWO_000964 [Cyclotella atomus]|uniref:Uncharacterized protein n=1 Tax=Cyclotella atomus TaxID=382360 RepID=A0ABD3MQJ6_9STRA